MTSRSRLPPNSDDLNARSQSHVQNVQPREQERVRVQNTQVQVQAKRQEREIMSLELAQLRSLNQSLIQRAIHMASDNNTSRSRDVDVRNNVPDSNYLDVVIKALSPRQSHVQDKSTDEFITEVQNIVHTIAAAQIPFGTWLLMSNDLTWITDILEKAQDIFCEDNGDLKIIAHKNGSSQSQVTFEHFRNECNDFELQISRDITLFETYKNLLTPPKFSGLSSTFLSSEVHDSSRLFIAFILFLTRENMSIKKDGDFSPADVHMSWVIDMLYEIKSVDGSCVLVPKTTLSKRADIMAWMQNERLLCVYQSLHHVDRFRSNYEAVILGMWFKEMLVNYKNTSNKFMTNLIDFTSYRIPKQTSGGQIGGDKLQNKLTKKVKTDLLSKCRSKLHLGSM